MLQWLISVWHLYVVTPHPAQCDHKRHADTYLYASVFYSVSARAIPRADTNSRGNSGGEWLLAAV